MASPGGKVGRGRGGSASNTLNPVYPTPQYLFSASLDGRIKVWDTAKQLLMQTLHRHRSGIQVLVRGEAL